MDDALRRRLDAALALLGSILVFTVVVAHELDPSLTVTALAVLVVVGIGAGLRYDAQVR